MPQGGLTVNVLLKRGPTPSIPQSGHLAIKPQCGLTDDMPQRQFYSQHATPVWTYSQHATKWSYCNQATQWSYSRHAAGRSYRQHATPQERTYSKQATKWAYCSQATKWSYRQYVAGRSYCQHTTQEWTYLQQACHKVHILQSSHRMVLQTPCCKADLLPAGQQALTCSKHATKWT